MERKSVWKRTHNICKGSNRMKKYGVRCTCCKPNHIFNTAEGYETCIDNVDGKFVTNNLNKAYVFFGSCYTADLNVEVFEKNNE